MRSNPILVKVPDGFALAEENIHGLGLRALRLAVFGRKCREDVGSPRVAFSDGGKARSKFALILLN